jgi:hypothetical protein
MRIFGYSAISLASCSVFWQYRETLARRVEMVNHQQTDLITGEAIIFFTGALNASHSRLLSLVPKDRWKDLDQGLRKIDEKFAPVINNGSTVLGHYATAEWVAVTEELVGIWSKGLGGSEQLVQAWPVFGRTRKISRRLTELNAPQLAKFADSINRPRPRPSRIATHVCRPSP